MNYGDGGLSASDVALLQGRNGSGDGFGENSSWWVIIFLIFAFSGWGRNGFGGIGGTTDGTSGAMNNYVLASDFSQLSRQMSDGFNSQERKLDIIANGLCDGFYTQAQLINGVNQNISNAQYNLQNAVMTNGYETRIGINGIGSQLASCCCDIREAISGVNYNMAMNNNALQNTICNTTRDIIDNQNANYRALHDEMVANRIEDKNAQIQAQQNEINALRLKASQEQQNNFLISRLGTKCPEPAYIVPNPNCCYNYQVTQNTGCNCGNY